MTVKLSISFRLCNNIVFVSFQGVPSSTWWYFIIYISIFWSLTLTHFFETKRKDFWAMLIHHLVALFTVILIWILNVHRAGIVMLFLHDVSELPLFALKSLFYYKPGSMVCNIMLVLFNVLWFVARLYLFPRLVYTTFAPGNFPYNIYPLYWVMLTFCCLLIVLHVLWSFMIIKLDIRTFKKGQIDRDIRSSSEGELCEN